MTTRELKEEKADTYYPGKDPPKRPISKDDIYSLSLQTVVAVPVDFTDSLTAEPSLATQTETGSLVKTRRSPYL